MNATHYLPLKTDRKIATLFYSWDGEQLFYHSTCGGGWFISAEKNPEEFVNNNLVKIEE